LTAFLRPREPHADLPDNATLVIQDESNGGQRRLPMTGDATATFHVTRPAANDDFQYRVEAGLAASEWYSVRVADAVELTDSTTIEVVPPAYANRPAKSFTSISDLEALQHSTVQFRLRFSRAAE